MNIKARLWAACFQLLPFLRWGKPAADQLRADLVAGVTVGLVLIPQALAYAQLAGMPPVTGLYAALLPGIVGALFGSSSLLAVGPVALSSLLTFAALQPLAEPGSSLWVSMAIWLAIYSGLIQLAMGALRMGAAANIISNAVIQGFINAAAVIIILSQLPSLLGFAEVAGDNWLLRLRHAWQADADRVLTTALFGGGSILALLLCKQLVPRLPAIVLVCLAGIGLSSAIGFASLGGSVVGRIASGLPSLGLPTGLTLEQHLALLTPAVVIALISFTEAMSSCRTMSRLTRETWNRNQELIGQGLAKIASGASGGFPVSGSFSRTALNAYSGARSAWSTIITSLIVLVCLLGFTDLLHNLPKAVLAAVIIVPVLRLIDIPGLLKLLRTTPKDGAVALITLGVTLATVPNLYWGIIAGILASVVLFLYRYAVPRIIELGVHDSGALRDRQLYGLPAIADDVLGIRMDASLSYLTAPVLESYIRRRIDTLDIRHLLLSATAINQIDSTGLDTLHEIWLLLNSRGIRLYLSGAKLPLRTALHQQGYLALFGEDCLLASDAQAVALLRGDQAPS
ncbi:SulP family inorganic anion transporter [Pseudomonas abyssi]|uniref:SulP family inorganic anion transporter n=1 Tax=Pseudomonas abyssi TaxID=170540 RepID=UPI003C7B050E